MRRQGSRCAHAAAEAHHRHGLEMGSRWRPCFRWRLLARPRAETRTRRVRSLKTNMPGAPLGYSAPLGLGTPWGREGWGGGSTGSRPPSVVLYWPKLEPAGSGERAPALRGRSGSLWRPMNDWKPRASIAAQKRSFWKQMSTFERTVVEEIRGCIARKFRRARPFLVLGNGPVTVGCHRATMRLIRETSPIVVAFNDYERQCAFKGVSPDIVAVTQVTRRRDAVLRRLAVAGATAFILVRGGRSRWREQLWQPLAPLHCCRLQQDALEVVQRTASTTSGFFMLGVLHLLWPKRCKYIVGFGGPGHSSCPRDRIYEGAVAEFCFLTELAQVNPLFRHVCPSSQARSAQPLARSAQPLAREACPRCPPRRAAAGAVRAGHGYLRCNFCGRRWKPSQAPPRVPLCPLHQGSRGVVRNGSKSSIAPFVP